MQILLFFDKFSSKQKQLDTLWRNLIIVQAHYEVGWRKEGVKEMKGVEGGQPWGIPECLVKITDLWWLELVVGSVLNKSLWLMITTVFLLFRKTSSYPDLGQRFFFLLLKLSSFFSSYAQKPVEVEMNKR